MAYNNETGMYEGYIYIICNDINPDKYYIGQTSVDVLTRWIGHMRQAKESLHESTDKLHNAMCLYGVEHFAADTIATYKRKSKEDLINILDEMEMYFISKFDSYYNGYNSTKGGRQSNNHMMKSVQQFDLNGKFIAEFESVDSLKEHFGFDSVATIYSCCHHNCKYAYGYLWKYKSDNTPLPVLTNSERKEAETRHLLIQPIDKYDYRGNKLCTYKNVDEAAEQNPHIDRLQIYKSCTGIAVYAGVDVYRFSKDKFDTYRTFREKPKLVEQYNLDNDFVAVYESVRDAARQTGICCSHISAVCRHEGKTAGDYLWRYVEDNKGFEDLDHTKHCKKVYQYDKNGELVNIFLSIKEASEETNIGEGSISLNAKNIKNSINQAFVWSFTPITKDEVVQKTVNKNAKPILQFTKTGEFIASYPSGQTAALQFPDHNNPVQLIYACCNGKKKSAYGYVWKYIEDCEERRIV